MPDIIHSKHICVFHLIPTRTLYDKYYDYPHFIEEEILQKLSNMPKIVQLKTGGASLKSR